MAVWSSSGSSTSPLLLHLSVDGLTCFTLQRALKAHIVTGDGGQFIDEIKLHAAMRLSLLLALGL